jgi:cell fate regulator YaaT (PSP1 superfamily)
MKDEYQNLDDEDISALEDRPSEGADDIIAGAGASVAEISPDTPVYRLRLLYSQETFLAVYKGDALPALSMVIVPTRYGRDLAQVIGPTHICRASPVSEIAWIERAASKDDLEKAKNNSREEQEAFHLCKEKIEEHGLDLNPFQMKLVHVHFLLEEPKILFLFTAENRVDFRKLVKDLVSIFRMRIELRQIGVRDEARVVGGLGVCGRCFCCHSLSDKLRPVSIKMAKDQNLSLNSMKISGPCGRLLCCLSYENNFYTEQQRLMPQEGAWVSYENSTWKVCEVNMISGVVKIAHEDGRTVTLPSCRFEKTDSRWRAKAL